MSKDMSINNVETDKPETLQNIDESELDAVTGGLAVGTCYFVAEYPIKHKIENGTVLIRCRTHILRCKCGGTERCVDNYHKMHKLAPKLWSPAPVTLYNHDTQDKAVRQWEP